MQNSIELHLVKTKIGERIYELKNQEQTVASLHFLKANGTGATIHANEQNWVLKRKGFWTPYIVVTKKHTDEVYAKVPFSLEKISFEKPVGDTLFVLNNTSFWKGEWRWVDLEQNPLIDYQPKNAEASLGNAIISAEGQQVENYELLCMLGWYMIVCMNEENDAAADILVSVA
jgi:hypothetical protein